MTTVTITAHRPGMALAEGPQRARHERAERRVGRAIALAIWTMPLLVPTGPGNTATADVTIVAAVVTTFLWLRWERLPVRLPFLVPMAILMLTGAVAAEWAAAESAALAIIQDAFCLLWGATIANAVRHRQQLLETVLRAAVWSGIAWAGVLCFGRMAGINVLAGITAKDGTRAALTFNDPNLAANYFLFALTMLLATSVVRRRPARFLAGALILLAIIFTGSNGAAIGLAVIVVVVAVLGMRRRHGAAAALALLTLGVLTVGGISPHVNLNSIQQHASDSIAILKDSLGRSDESTGTREVLASEGLNLFLKGDLVGVGPSRTKATLHDDGAPYVKEAHNDYLATLVERGAAGGAGLALLIGFIGLRLGRVARWPQRAEVRELIPRPEYFVGLACAFAIGGIFYEVLHFRHLWAFLGLVAGIDPGLRDARSRLWD